MRINNVSSETSIQLVVIMSLITFVMTAAFVIGYITTSEYDITFFGFFQWLFNMFQSLRTEMSDSPFLPWLILIMIIGSYAGFFGSIISRHNALARFNSGLNI